MRPTGLGSGFYKDHVDYSVFCGEWCILRKAQQVQCGAGSAAVLI
jgi:hypothetical protein